MLTINKILIKLIIWFLINTAIALVIVSFLSINSTTPIQYLIIPTLIITHITSSLCAVSGYSIGHFLNKKSLIIEVPLVLIGTLCAAIIGHNISHYIISCLSKNSIYIRKSIYFIPSLLIAAIVTIITVVIEKLKYRQVELEKNLNKINESLKTSNLDNQSLSFKENENYCVIKCDDLIYLSSHGKKIILHTTEKDYEINQLLKDIKKKLSGSFIRIHKQFIININYVSQIKYYEGGRYMAYLKDEDESALPVGRKIAPLLKEKLGL
jgi:hypothetical protein